MAPTSRERLVLRLNGLREQRRQQRMGSNVLQARIRSAVAEAQAEGISVSEIARLLDMDRSALYRTYLADAPAA